MLMADVNIYNAYMQVHHCIKPIPVHATVHVDTYNMLVRQPTSPSGPRVGGVSTQKLLALNLQRNGQNQKLTGKQYQGPMQVATHSY